LGLVIPLLGVAKPDPREMLILRWVAVVAALLGNTALGQIRILAPASLAEEFKDTRGNIQGTTATFGAPYYGERLLGQIQWGESLHEQTHCTEEDYAIEGENGEPNDIQAAMPEAKMIKIIMVRRGKCTFVTKVRVAKKKGAHAVIIIDREDSELTSATIPNVIMADDGYGDQLDIPSILISKQDGKHLLDAVQRPQPVIVELAWDIPTNHFVTMDLWMSSASREDAKFLMAFRENAKELGDNLHFVPHFHVFSMPADYNDLCSDGSARFCAEDPDGSGPITGAMVLREDVRQLCILETSGALVNEQVNAKKGGYHYVWWDYVTELNKQCPIDGTSEEHRFGDTCSLGILKSTSGIDQNAVTQCVLTTSDKKLEHERANIAWSARAIRINGWRYSGQLDPVLATRALCSGFIVPPKECESLVQPRKIFETTNQISEGIGVGTFVMVLFVGLILIFSVLLLYKRFLQKQMHGQMRDEVMLEVRSQMESYQKLPET
jgi:hypothetical protein